MTRTLLCVLILLSVHVQAASIPQDPDPAYTQVINKRAQKIVETLGITDADKALQVRLLIADQYRSLSLLHDTRDAQVRSARTRAGDNKELADQLAKALQDLTQALQDKLHVRYLLKLSALLTSEQIDQVKDGMTYGVVQITYTSYLDMLKVKQTLDDMGWKGWLVIERSRDASNTRDVVRNFGANTKYMKSVFQTK